MQASASASTSKRAATHRPGAAPPRKRPRHRHRPRQAEPGGARARRLTRQVQTLREELEVERVFHEAFLDSQRELEASRQRYVTLYDHAPVGYVTLDGKGVIREANLAAASMFGPPRQQVIGRRLLIFVHQPDRQAALRYVSALRRGVAEVVAELKLASGRSALRTVQLRSTRLEAEAAEGPPRYLVVLTDITDRKVAEEEIKAARQLADQARDTANQARATADQARTVAEQASQAKDHFLAVLSHELRTPLHPALMAATILEASPHLPADLGEDARIIRRNVELEALLIDDMLDLTRIARNKLTLHRRVVDLREVLQYAIETCNAEVADKGLSLEFAAPPQPLWVDADPARLQQVFWNLLKNAIKFTPAPGVITVVASATEPVAARGKGKGKGKGKGAGGAGLGSLRVEVRDTGKGIAAETLSSIFNIFEQGGGEVTRQYGGLGLGLAICKGLIVMHGGSIHAQSPGPGMGATFVVELPQSAPPPKQALRPAAPAQGVVSASGRHILLVEDHDNTAMITSRLLRSWGYQVSTAPSVQTALKAFAEEPIDLVISDLGLPDGTGHDLMQQLLARRAVPGIALSGYGMDADIQRSAQAGFLEHLVKPINARQLEEAITRALGADLRPRPRAGAGAGAGKSNGRVS